MLDTIFTKLPQTFSGREQSSQIIQAHSSSFCAALAKMVDD
jgi:hypothetical protein